MRSRETIAAHDQLTEAAPEPTRFMWMELTNQCQLKCGHCYAESGPDGAPSVLSADQMRRAIDGGIEYGVQNVQFIGGEPTLHPALPDLISYARGRGVGVEIYTNLVHVPRKVWETSSHGGVSLATSYYSTDPKEHREITGRNTYPHTKRNIAKAISLGIPIRAGIVDVLDGQDVEGAVAELIELGVPEESIKIDHVRGVGRGAIDAAFATREGRMNEGCGACANGKVAITSTGEVVPCVFMRSPDMVAGMVGGDISLETILAGQALAGLRHNLRRVFEQRAGNDPACPPDECPPDTCPPALCPPDCDPNAFCHPRNEPCPPRNN